MWNRNKENKLIIQIDDTYEEYERKINIDTLPTNAKNINRIIGVQNIEEQKRPVLAKKLTPPRNTGNK